MFNDKVQFRWHKEFKKSVERICRLHSHKFHSADDFFRQAALRLIQELDVDWRQQGELVGKRVQEEREKLCAKRKLAWKRKKERDLDGVV